MMPLKPHSCTAPARCHPAQRGQSLVEGTLVMLVFFAMLLGVVDFGQIVLSHQSLTERVRAAARWGALHPDAGRAALTNQVLYGQVNEPNRATPGFLGLKPENVIVEHRVPTPQRPDDETLSITIVGFETHLFAPWISRVLVSARPVSVTAPIVPRQAAAGDSEPLAFGN